MVFLSPFHVLAQNKILNIRHWAAPDHTRVVFDADNVIPYTIEKADRKLSIVFQNTDMPENLPAVIILNKRGIEKIILSSLPEKILRVELSIDANVETKVFTVKKIQDKPDRVVIDILFPDVVKQETKEREEVKVLRKNKIIVIDPGHGGGSSGAVGIGSGGSMGIGSGGSITLQWKDFYEKATHNNCGIVDSGLLRSCKVRVWMSATAGMETRVVLSDMAFRGLAEV